MYTYTVIYTQLTTRCTHVYYVHYSHTLLYTHIYTIDRYASRHRSIYTLPPGPSAAG